MSSPQYDFLLRRTEHDKVVDLVKELSEAMNLVRNMVTFQNVRNQLHIVGEWSIVAVLASTLVALLACAARPTTHGSMYFPLLRSQY